MNIEHIITVVKQRQLRSMYSVSLRYSFNDYYKIVRVYVAKCNCVVYNVAMVRLSADVERR